MLDRPQNQNNPPSLSLTTLSPPTRWYHLSNLPCNFHFHRRFPCNPSKNPFSPVVGPLEWLLQCEKWTRRSELLRESGRDAEGGLNRVKKSIINFDQQIWLWKSKMMVQFRVSLRVAALGLAIVIASSLPPARASPGDTTSAGSLKSDDHLQGKPQEPEQQDQSLGQSPEMKSCPRMMRQIFDGYAPIGKLVLCWHGGRGRRTQLEMVTHKMRGWDWWLVDECVLFNMIKFFSCY